MYAFCDFTFYKVVHHFMRARNITNSLGSTEKGSDSFESTLRSELDK